MANYDPKHIRVLNPYRSARVVSRPVKIRDWSIGRRAKSLNVSEPAPTPGNRSWRKTTDRYGLIAAKVFVKTRVIKDKSINKNSRYLEEPAPTPRLITKNTIKLHDLGYTPPGFSKSTGPKKMELQLLNKMDNTNAKILAMMMVAMSDQGRKGLEALGTGSSAQNLKARNSYNKLINDYATILQRQLAPGSEASEVSRIVKRFETELSNIFNLDMSHPASAEALAKAASELSDGMGWDPVPNLDEEADKDFVDAFADPYIYPAEERKHPPTTEPPRPLTPESKYDAPTAGPTAEPPQPPPLIRPMSPAVYQAIYGPPVITSLLTEFLKLDPVTREKDTAMKKEFDEVYPKYKAAKSTKLKKMYVQKINIIMEAFTGASLNLNLTQLKKFVTHPHRELTKLASERPSPIPEVKSAQVPPLPEDPREDPRVEQALGKLKEGELEDLLGQLDDADTELDEILAGLGV
jgi:hypothetical protein